MRALWIILLLVPSFAWAGLGARLVHTRYFGHRNFNSSSVQNYNLDPSRGNQSYTRGNGGTHVYHGDCKGILGGQQEFALRRMVEEGYIKAEEALKYEKGGRDQFAAQINFFQMSSSLENFPGSTNDILATFWTVAGQGWWDASRPAVYFRVSWQKEARLAKIAARLDRNRFRFVWEWGREAQAKDEIGSTVYLKGLASASTYRELRALGGKLEDGWITFHLLDQEATDRHRARHGKNPKTVIIENEEGMNPGESIFIVPLQEMMERFPVSRVSSEISEILALAHGKLTEPQVLDLITEFNRNTWTELDTSYPEVRSGPLVITDWTTQIKHEKIFVYLMDLGLEHDDAVAITNRLSAIPPETHSAAMGQYHDVADVWTSAQNIFGKEVYELSNLDVQSALRDSRYLPFQLLGAFGYEVQRIAPMLQVHPDHNRLQMAMEHLFNHQVQFAISTWDPILGQQIERLKPTEVKTFRNPGIDFGPGQLLWAETPWVKDAHTKPLTTYFFSIERIGKIMEEQNWDTSSLFVLREGVWEIQKKLSNFSIF